MKRKIAVITGTRAEYGLLYWTMKEICKSDLLKLQLIVTGSHLSEKFGNTYSLIEKDGFKIDCKIDLNIIGDQGPDIALYISKTIERFADAYEKMKPDIILVLGDRYEILGAVTAALPFRIPVAHISGGEVTEGALDDQIRHAITKMSHIHFPGADEAADIIRKMGEEKWRIHNVGEPGIENINKTDLMSKDCIYNELGIDLNKKTILVTLHPTTLNSREVEIKESRAFFNVLKNLKDINIVITYPNADGNGDIIIDEIKKTEGFPNIYTFINLGRIKYLSLMKYCDAVVGNSSSGIIEAPYLKVPTVDYGDRQKGRLKAESILSCEADETKFGDMIQKALYDEQFISTVQETKSIYGEGNTSTQIVKVLENIKIDKNLIRKKLSFGG